MQGVLGPIEIKPTGHLALDLLARAHAMPARGLRAKVDVHFAGHDQALCNYLKQYDAVVGCVAWLTNEKLLAELAKRQASIVVQKEDFLRTDVPDARHDETYKRNLRRAYDAIPIIGRSTMYRSSRTWNIANTYPSCYGAPSDATPGGAIRCAGMAPENNSPKMHHKFIVFCSREERSKVVPGTEDEYTDDEGMSECPHPTHRTVEKWQEGIGEIVYKEDVLVPRAVWTGSFNWSETAVRSLENAVFIESEAVARKFYDEFLWIWAHSEPLDWKYKSSQPEYQITD